jgi:hypothetical protein
MWILFAVTIALIAWDVHVATNAVRGDTISELILFWAHQHPTLPFAFGILMGHLFWPQIERRD